MRRIFDNLQHSLRMIEIWEGRPDCNPDISNVVKDNSMVFVRNMPFILHAPRVDTIQVHSQESRLPDIECKCNHLEIKTENTPSQYENKHKRISAIVQRTQCVTLMLDCHDLLRLHGPSSHVRVVSVPPFANPTPSATVEICRSIRNVFPNVCWISLQAKAQKHALAWYYSVGLRQLQLTDMQYLYQASKLMWLGMDMLQHFRLVIAMDLSATPFPDVVHASMLRACLLVGL
eukprot:TRINITY_DN12729_c0_g1_i1.p1 TRINITY_DN12729_c0_g1~~TRINITY_DN12729_c0_g1_i1.p1  ORF type:complete len:232 (+),score=18.11 TRINITY_DN12729_c0_g1_i1:786-1481(+)